MAMLPRARVVAGSPCGTSMLRPSTAPRWKITTSTFDRAARDCASARADEEARRRAAAAPRARARRPSRTSAACDRCMRHLLWNSGEPSTSAASLSTSVSLATRSSAVVPRDLRALELRGQHGARLRRRRAVQHRREQPVEHLRPAARGRAPATSASRSTRAPRNAVVRRAPARSSCAPSSAPGVHPRLGRGRGSRWAAAPRRAAARAADLARQRRPPPAGRRRRRGRAASRRPSSARTALTTTSNGVLILAPIRLARPELGRRDDRRHHRANVAVGLAEGRGHALHQRRRRLVAHEAAGQLGRR